jgi:hypothetical protein
MVGLEQIVTSAWICPGVTMEIVQNLMEPRNQTLAIVKMDTRDTCVMYLNAIQHAIKNMENVWKERVQIFAFVILAGRVKLVMTVALIGIVQKRMKQ